MGVVVRLAEQYRHEITAANVTRVDGHYEPELNWLWTEPNRMAWILGVLALNSGLSGAMAVRLFKESRSPRRYKIQFGANSVMEDLNESQVWDALTAANEVVALIRKAN